MSKRKREPVDFGVASEKVEDIFDVEIQESTEPAAVHQEVPMVGVVADCLRLNIRAYPSNLSAVVGNVTCLSEVLVTESESVGDYYKITTSDGTTGFCMKKYIVFR